MTNGLESPAVVARPLEGEGLARRVGPFAVSTLIAGGAALIFHHAWSGLEAWTTRPYDAGAHALAGVVGDVDAADAELAPLVTDDLLARVVADVPDEWLTDEPAFPDVAAVRAASVPG